MVDLLAAQLTLKLQETNAQAQIVKSELETRFEQVTSELSTLNVILAEKVQECQNLKNKSANIKQCNDICEDNVFKIATLDKQLKRSHENVKLLKEETKLLECKLENVKESQCPCNLSKRKRPNNEK